MADSSPTPERSDEEPAPDRSLTARWRWQGAMLAGAGVIVIVWQWDMVAKGDAIAATWAMVALGAAAVVAGGVLLLKDRPSHQGPGDDGV